MIMDMSDMYLYLHFEMAMLMERSSHHPMVEEENHHRNSKSHNYLEMDYNVQDWRDDASMVLR